MSARRFPWRRRLGRLALILLVGYLAICAELYFKQVSLIYPGSTRQLSTEEAIQQAAEFGLVPWAHPTPGAASPQGYVEPDFAGPAPRGTIVYFHGNGETAFDGDRPAEFAAFRQRGFRTFYYEYPGFGGRPGHPSEQAIVPDAQALIRELDQMGFGPVYVCGESLGTGVAAAACADPALPVHGLLLLMPFDSLWRVAAARYWAFPVRLMIHDHYDSALNLAHFRHPVCVIAGSADEIVPPWSTQALFAALPDPKKLIIQSGYGHGNWSRAPSEKWWDESLDFIAPASKS
jgi:alpha-beta hydrolase superfamily lysophospholipase